MNSNGRGNGGHDEWFFTALEVWQGDAPRFDRFVIQARNEQYVKWALHTAMNEMGFRTKIANDGEHAWEGWDRGEQMNLDKIESLDRDVGEILSEYLPTYRVWEDEQGYVRLD